MQIIKAITRACIFPFPYLYVHLLIITTYTCTMYTQLFLRLRKFCTYNVNDLRSFHTYYTLRILSRNFLEAF